MSIRPILAGACALALIVPAAASARPAVGPFTHAYGGQGVTYGSTAYALQNQRDLGPAAQSQGVTYGDTAYALQNQRDLGSPAPHAPRGLAAFHPTPSGVHVVTLTDGQLQAAFIASHPDAKAIPAHLSDAQIAAAFLTEKPILGQERDGGETYLLVDQAPGTDCQGDPAVPGGTCVLRSLRPDYR